MNNSELWIRFLPPKPNPSLRLFCFPYVGGNSNIFRTWSNYLPASVEICAIELPGRGKRIMDAPLSDIDTLIDILITVFKPYLNEPFAFFGHSMGALISFELTRKIRQKYNIEPDRLFVSGHRAPQIPNPETPIYDLPEADFIEQLRSIKGTPQAVLENDEMMKIIMPVLRADFEICDTYIYTPDVPLNCSIIAFGGDRDKGTKRGKLRAWQNQTKGSFSKYILSGNHFFLHSAQKDLLELLSQQLSSVENAMSR